ncbi:TetR/AcrR family transcriptional regulator C-terminal domain-containing protein [Streptomyces coeruleorubidus]|uniref:TetR/AcrR family transcriptional regulator C-terminal domain-containing protein n=1 Tax=Streptomyces coeruleorubidus TaxID=116188 RepID=UPI0019A141EE|nr:hypothetical protein GCM10010256_09460 [Streptomyces coeruleorubidus]
MRPAAPDSPAASAAWLVQPSSASRPVSPAREDAAARSYLAAFAAHPRAIPLLMTSPVRAPRVLEQYERAVTLLLDAGFDPAGVMPLLTALENLVLGSALDLAASETMWELTASAPTPRLAQALSAVSEGRADRAFEVGLTGVMNHARELRAGRGEG